MPFIELNIFHKYKMSEEKYVNPSEIVKPDAEPLSDERTQEILHDSYRKSDVFIKDHMDPVFVMEEGTGKAVISDKAQRPWGVVSFHLLKQPIAINGNQNQVMYGYYKIRGPGGFEEDGDAMHFAQQIFQSHDCYSKMFAAPFGVWQPLTTWEANVEEAAAQEHFREEIASKKEDEEKFIVQQRLAEERARRINEEGIKDGSIDDYVKQQLRWHAADKRLEKAKKMIEEADRVMDEATIRITEMLASNPEYKEDGFQHFVDQMEAVGERTPTSYYDQVMLDMEKDDLPAFMQ